MKLFGQLVTILMLFNADVYSRPVRRVSLAEMFDAAEFVVIAQVSGTEDGVIRKQILNGHEDAKQMLAPVRVIRILKGAATLSDTKLSWFQPITKAPSGASGFEPLIGGYYVMFLKSELGLQRLRAVTGDDDPDMSLFLVGRDEPTIKNSSDPMTVTKQLLMNNELAVHAFRLEEPQQSLPPVSGTRGTPAAYAPAAPGIPER